MRAYLISLAICSDGGVSSYMGAHEGGTNPDGPVGDQGAQLLIANITDTRNTLKAAGYDLPVGTGDAGAYFNTEVLEAVDFGVRALRKPYSLTDADCV